VLPPADDSNSCFHELVATKQLKRKKKDDRQQKKTTCVQVKDDELRCKNGDVSPWWLLLIDNARAYTACCSAITVFRWSNGPIFKWG
jgi:hypothetical protein